MPIAVPITIKIPPIAPSPNININPPVFLGNIKTQSVFLTNWVQIFSYVKFIYTIYNIQLILT